MKIKNIFLIVLIMSMVFITGNLFAAQEPINPPMEGSSQSYNGTFDVTITVPNPYYGVVISDLSRGFVYGGNAIVLENFGTSGQFLIKDAGNSMKWATFTPGSSGATYTGSSSIDISTENVLSVANQGITDTKIALHNVKSHHIDDHEILTNHIASYQVTTIKIANSAVTTNKLADKSVTVGKLDILEVPGQCPTNNSVLGYDASLGKLKWTNTVACNEVFTVGNIYLNPISPPLNFPMNQPSFNYTASTNIMCSGPSPNPTNCNYTFNAYDSYGSLVHTKNATVENSNYYQSISSNSFIYSYCTANGANPVHTVELIVTKGNQTITKTTGYTAQIPENLPPCPDQ